MKEYIKLLKNCPLFNKIEEEYYEQMLSCLEAKVVSFKRKEYILSEGDPAKYIGILLTGRAQIEQVDYFGNRVILTDIQPSEMMGESFACSPLEHMPVSVQATEDSRVLFLDWSGIVQPCSNGCGFHRQLMFNLLGIVASKNILFHQKLDILSKRTTRDKLLAYLMMQAKKNNSSRFTIPFDRQELADYLQVERSGLSAEIGKLRKEGIIDNKKNDFVLLKDVHNV